MFINYLDKLTEVLIERKIITPDNRETVTYGLSTGIEIILNLITTLVIALILNMVLECIVFLISFALIRVYAGGYHLKKALNCYFLSNGIVALVLIIVKIIPKEHIFITNIVLLAISVPIILKFAPIGTPNKPLSDREKEYFRKNILTYISMELIIIFILLLFEMKTLPLLISLGIFISSFLILIAQYKYSHLFYH